MFMKDDQTKSADVNVKEEKPINLDDVLVNELGQFGHFQLFNVLLLAAPMMMNGWMNDYVFSAATIPHRCAITECELEANAIYEPEWILNAIPKAGKGLSSCHRYSLVEGFNNNLNFCPANAFNKSVELNCDKYVYAWNNSVVYDFNLGCQDWLRVLAGTLNSVGTLVVMPICGYISDKYGRRLALVISLFNAGLIGIIRGFSVNYPMYLLLQLLQTALGAGIFSTAYVLATELIGPKYRTRVSAFCSFMFSVGEVTLGGIAWLVPNWRHMTLILYTICLSLISFCWILNESVRWLLFNKKYDEARKILQRAATVNRKQISENSLDTLTRPTSPTMQEQVPSSNLMSSALKYPVMIRRICTTPIWWISVTCIYYGLAINSTSLSESTHLNYILTAAIDLPGFVTGAFLLHRLGRKPTLSGGFFLCAVCNIAFAFISPDQPLTRLLLYLVGKYSIAIVFNSLYLYTFELYPTEYRHTLLAFSSMVGRLGSIAAPMTPVLMIHWRGIPSLIFGFLGLLSGLLILTQPETLGTKLPDTFAEAATLGKSVSNIKHIS